MGPNCEEPSLTEMCNLSRVGMEKKEISLRDIFPSFEQPRSKFKFKI